MSLQQQTHEDVLRRVQGEYIEHAIQHSYSQAIKEHKLQPVASPKVSKYQSGDWYVWQKVG